MGRHKDHSPVGYTCPWIDEAIDVLRNSECTYNTNEVYSAINALEKVRSANDELRSWGNELYAEVEELKAEIDRLETIIADT
jgi:hypothetical protein